MTKNINPAAVAQDYDVASTNMVRLLRRVWPTDEVLDLAGEPFELGSHMFPAVEGDTREVWLHVTAHSGARIRQVYMCPNGCVPVVQHWWTVDEAVDRLGARYIASGLACAYGDLFDVLDKQGVPRPSHAVEAHAVCSSLAGALRAAGRSRRASDSSDPRGGT